MSDDTAANAPSGNATRIGLRADMTIDDEAVAVEGILGGDFFLQLSRPATLGTPISFAYWLSEEYKVENLDIMLPTETYKEGKHFKAAYKAYKATNDEDERKRFEATITDHLDGKVPAQLANLVKTAFLAELTITDLLIDIKEEDATKDVKSSKKMMFGLSVGFPSSLKLLPSVEVNKLSILVMNAPKDDFTFPQRVVLPAPTSLPVEPSKAKGYIAFSGQPAADSTITLGGDTWTFVTSAEKGKPQIALGSSLDATLVAMTASLNAATAGDTAKCSYRANLDDGRLEITCRTEGFGGNGFAIAADEASRGIASAGTLSGGYGASALRPQASGSITFSEVPGEDGIITLDGVKWGFSTAEPGAKELKSKIGDTVEATVTNLAAALTASDNPVLGKAAYEAKGTVLTITAIKAGEDGNAFKIAANSASKGKTSGSNLTGG